MVDEPLVDNHILSENVVMGPNQKPYTHKYVVNEQNCSKL